MSLSEPVGRKEVHARKVISKAYLRDDDLWDIEGHIVDTRPYAYPNDWRGMVQPGDPVHEMRVRITLDDEMTLRDAEAVTIKSPYAICGDAAPNFAAIKGLRIGPGWLKDVRARIGGTHCCTHIVELLGPMATVAYQSIPVYRARQRAEASGNGDGYGTFMKPPLDHCYALSTDREVVKRHWPEDYKGA